MVEQGPRAHAGLAGNREPPIALSSGARYAAAGRFGDVGIDHSQAAPVDSVADVETARRLHRSGG